MHFLCRFLNPYLTAVVGEVRGNDDPSGLSLRDEAADRVGAEIFEQSAGRDGGKVA